MMASQGIPSWRKSDNAGPKQSQNPRKRPAASDLQEEAWVAEEDQFVLRQTKRKAALRVKAKRPKPIDWLAVTLSVIDPAKNPLDEDEEGADLEVADPEGIIESLNQADLEELSKDVTTYLDLEQHASNREYWQTMKLICKERLSTLKANKPSSRGIGNVSVDVDKLLGPKSFEELETLEKQVRRKLNSNEPIDVDYWEQLLGSIQSFKAKARLRKVSQAIVSRRLESLRKQQEDEARIAKSRLRPFVEHLAEPSSTHPRQSENLDPEPFLKLAPEDKGLESVDERAFLVTVTQERQRNQKLGYVPGDHKVRERPIPKSIASSDHTGTLGVSRLEIGTGGETSEVANAQFHREVARGVQENEEVFETEESLHTTSASQPLGRDELRKPKFYNRVQLGYEWNKYNQTHYDHDNPPPKVVQGYRFNIFYPNLLDKSKAPTYKIEREGGRKRGQTFAPAGEEDTCVIRFIAGAPYEDIGFRIVDKEWDFSAKRERGFKSTFENGVLSLYFQFKKVYYRK